MLAKLAVLLAFPLLAAVGGDERPVDFARDIQVLFRKHCIACHSPQKAKGQLRLDVKAEALRGGMSGKAIVPGKSGSTCWGSITRS